MHDCSEDSNRPRKCAAEAKYFAHCGERPKALPLETASIFEKLLDQKTFSLKIHKRLFRQTEALFLQCLLNIFNFNIKL
jgi:hypothetical protein